MIVGERIGFGIAGGGKVWRLLLVFGGLVSIGIPTLTDGVGRGYGPDRGLEKSKPTAKSRLCIKSSAKREWVMLNLSQIR